jgi:hypothetical protein
MLNKIKTTRQTTVFPPKPILTWGGGVFSFGGFYEKTGICAVEDTFSIEDIFSQLRQVEPAKTRVEDSKTPGEVSITRVKDSKTWGGVSMTRVEDSKTRGCVSMTRAKLSKTGGKVSKTRGEISITPGRVSDTFLGEVLAMFWVKVH